MKSGIPLSRVVGELKAQRKLVGSAKSLGESSRQQVSQSGPRGKPSLSFRTPCHGAAGLGARCGIPSLTLHLLALGLWAKLSLQWLSGKIRFSAGDVRRAQSRLERCAGGGWQFTRLLA